MAKGRGVAEEFRLEVVYPLGAYETHDDAFERIVGRSRDGSGAGFGVRDLSWTFRSRKRAVKAYRALLARNPLRARGQTRGGMPFRVTLVGPFLPRYVQRRPAKPAPR